MPNVPAMPLVPVFPAEVPNTQGTEPFCWVSSDKTEGHMWRTDEDGLSCLRVTRVTTDVYDQWTCTR